MSIQPEPRYKMCSRCDGRGHHDAYLVNLGTRNREQHIVTCEQPGCAGGILDTHAYYIAMGLPRFLRVNNPTKEENLNE